MLGKLSLKKGFKDGVPIALGYLSVSFSFGVQASILGLPVICTVLISMLNLTSAGQLAGVQVIASMTSLGSAIIQMIIVQSVINSRYFLMSIALSQNLDDSFNLQRRLVCAFAITDEIYAVSSSQDGAISHKYFYGLMILPYVGWTVGTLLGAILGNVLPSTIQNALGIALYAMFIAIIIPPCRKEFNILAVVLLSAGISCLIYYIPFFDFISQGIAIIISALIGAGVIAFIFPVKKEVN